MDENTVYYNRGVLQAAVIVEAIRNTLAANGGKAPTGEEVKQGFEKIHDFTLGGLVPPLQVTAQDHEGGGWVRVFEVKGNGLVPETDWFQAYRDVVQAALKKAGG
jgi:branched-chain amino acid transport system substrate-binding protein